VTLQIVKRDRAEYALRAGDGEVGRVREGVVHFHGFADEADARAGGAAACGALAEWYRERARAGHPAPVTPWPAAHSVPEDQRLRLGAVVVGRITRDVEAPGVEVALPAGVLHAVATHLIGRQYAAVAARRSTATAATLGERA